MPIKLDSADSTVPPGSYVNLSQLWRIAALKSNRIAHARNWTVQRDLHHGRPPRQAWNRGRNPIPRDAGFPRSGGGPLCLSLVENLNLVPLSR